MIGNGTTMRPVRWRGRSKNGVAATGDLLVGDVAWLVESRFRSGWRWLEVFDIGHGQQVGGICVDDETGRRVWWGERS